MTNETELANNLWKALKSDMTVMLSLAGLEEGHSRPMTAQLLDEDEDSPGGPIYFFTAKDTDLVRGIEQGHRCVAHFASKGHEIFASIHGELNIDNDPTTINRLWNRFVAAWYEGGKNDPKLTLLRLDPQYAQVWLNEHSLVAGIKLLLGRDPKREYRDKVADVRLDTH
jgi:general stress protein 26